MMMKREEEAMMMMMMMIMRECRFYGRDHALCSVFPRQKSTGTAS